MEEGTAALGLVAVVPVLWVRTVDRCPSPSPSSTGSTSRTSRASGTGTAGTSSTSSATSASTSTGNQTPVLN